MQIPSTFETLKSFKLGIQKSELQKTRMFIFNLGECTVVTPSKSRRKDTAWVTITNKITLFLLERQTLMYPSECLIGHGSRKWTFLSRQIDSVSRLLQIFLQRVFFFCIIVPYLGGSFTFYPHQIDWSWDPISLNFQRKTCFAVLFSYSIKRLCLLKEKRDHQGTWDHS